MLTVDVDQWAFRGQHQADVFITPQIYNFWFTFVFLCWFTEALCKNSYFSSNKNSSKFKISYSLSHFSEPWLAVFETSNFLLLSFQAVILNFKLSLMTFELLLLLWVMRSQGILLNQSKIWSYFIKDRWKKFHRYCLVLLLVQWGSEWVPKHLVTELILVKYLNGKYSIVKYLNGFNHPFILFSGDLEMLI